MTDSENHTDKLLADPQRLTAILRDARRQALREARQKLSGRQPDGNTPSDIAQSVVREILQGADEFEIINDPAVRGLVSQILLRKIAAKLRRTTAKKRDSGRSEPIRAEPEDAAPGPVSQVEAREYLAQIEDRMGDLSALQREALRLRLEGHTHQAIADHLGITVANAFKTVARARDKIRDHLS